MLSMSLEPDPFKMQSFLGLGHSPDTWSVARHVSSFFHSWQCLVLLAPSPWNQIIIWVAKFYLCHPGTGWIDPLSFCGLFVGLSGLCAQSWSRPQSVQPASGQRMPFKFSLRCCIKATRKQTGLCLQLWTESEVCGVRCCPVMVIFENKVDCL